MSESKLQPAFPTCFNPFQLKEHKRQDRRNLRKIRPELLAKLNISVTPKSLNYLICDSCRIKTARKLKNIKTDGDTIISPSNSRSTTNLENIVAPATAAGSSAIQSTGNDTIIGVSLVPVMKEEIIILNNTVVALKEPTPIIKRKLKVDEQDPQNNVIKIPKKFDKKLDKNDETNADDKSSKLPYNFRGHIAPALTPFSNDSTRSLNLRIIPQYAEFLADRGITGVLVNGTSGEGPSMNVEERKSVAETWARTVKCTKQHLMLQIGGAPLPDVLEMARHAENIGVDSLLCLPELYFKPTTPKQLVEYLRIVGQAAPRTPLLYYHIPMLTNVNINMAEFLDSIGDEIPSFVGIKFTSTNLEEGTKALHVNNKKFVIFLGNDQIMAGAFALGMDSAIATTFNMLPDLGNEILKASKAGDSAKAREMQEKLSQAVSSIAKYGNWVETMKVAMGLLTPFDLGPPRAPLNPLSTESVASMKNGLKALGLQVLR